MHKWDLQEAQNKLSELIDNTIHGPQMITSAREEVAVVLSVSEYYQLIRTTKRLSDFFQESPLAGSDLDLSRDKSPIQDDACL